MAAGPRLTASDPSGQADGVRSRPARMALSQRAPASLRYNRVPRLNRPA
jgi:hypothetical protein